MSDLWTDLRTGIRGALINDSEFQSIAGNRYYINFVPTEKIYPYVYTFDNFSNPVHELGYGISAEEVFWLFQVRGHYNAGGPERVVQLGGVVRRIIESQEVLIPNRGSFTAIRLYCDDVAQDPKDLQMFYQTMRYKIWIN